MSRYANNHPETMPVVEGRYVATAEDEEEARTAWIAESLDEQRRDLTRDFAALLREKARRFRDGQRSRLADAAACIGNPIRSAGMVSAARVWGAAAVQLEEMAAEIEAGA